MLVAAFVRICVVFAAVIAALYIIAGIESRTHLDIVVSVVLVTLFQQCLT